MDKEKLKRLRLQAPTNTPIKGRDTGYSNMHEIGLVIWRLNLVEKIIKEIITLYFKPKKKDKFENVLMNSDYISFGGKMNLLWSLGLITDKKIDKKKSEKQLFHDLINIRNTFAHNMLLFEQNGEVKVDKLKRGNDTIDRLSMKEKLDEFEDVFIEVIDVLRLIHEKLSPNLIRPWWS